MKKILFSLFALFTALSLSCYAVTHTLQHVIQSERQIKGDTLGRFSPEISVTFIIEKGYTEFEITKQIKEAIISHADETLKNIICGNSEEESDGFKAIIIHIFKQRKIPIYDVNVSYKCRNNKE